MPGKTSDVLFVYFTSIYDFRTLQCHYCILLFVLNSCQTQHWRWPSQITDRLRRHRRLYFSQLYSKLITMTSFWARWRLKSPAFRLYTQTFVHAQINKNIKVPRHWPSCRNSPVTGEFPARRASNAVDVSISWRLYGKTDRWYSEVDIYT